jgi:predicted DNA-binding protein YlxM (UPF0122 family)
MATRKMIAAAALTAAVATGGVVGATLGTPGISGAQDGTTTTTAPSTAGGADQTAPDRDGHRRGGFGGGIALDVAAETLGMTEDELRAALDEGKTLAEIATEKGVDRQALIDALVAAGEARLDEAKAALPDRIAEAVDRTFEGRGDRGGPGGFPMIGKGLDAAAETLGQTEDELRTALRDGKTLAEIATEKGVDRQALIDALVADAKAKLAEKVADGSITQEQADERAERLTEAVGSMVDGEGPMGRGGFGGGHGPGRGGPGGPDGEAPPADDAPSTDDGGT